MYLDLHRLAGSQATQTVRPSRAKRLLPLVDLPEASLLLHEIYASVQGEGTHVGLPCTFVRTTACHLRCTYCDTRKAFAGGERYAVRDALARVGSLGPKLVLITGGEPLLQPAVYPLMAGLLGEGYTVLLETSGAVSTAQVDPRVVTILDLKTPSSGECGANDYSNLSRLAPHHEVKFVLGDRNDYVWAKEVVKEAKLPDRCHVLFGPVWGALHPRELAEWIATDGLHVRLQVQLHKYIWGAHVEGV